MKRPKKTPARDGANPMKALLEPESVAVIGASRQTGETSLNIVENLLGYDYGGRIYPVNPKAKELLGLNVYPSIKDLPEKVDLAVLSTPRHLVPGLIRECGEAGVRVVIVVGQGFRDAKDEEGEQLHQEILQVVEETGVRVLGPNTIGSANAFLNFSTSFAKNQLERIPVGLACQTGIFLGRIHGQGLIGKGVDLGNAADIDFVDAMEYFETDPQVKVIALHIEGIPRGEKFLRTAERVSKKKPIIALKTGNSGRAAQSAMSHTGSLVGKSETWDAALKQSGVIRVQDIDELMDLAKAFAFLPLMKGKRTAIITLSGGMGIASLDALDRYGLEPAELSPETRNRLEEIAPSWFVIGNPLDIWPVMMVADAPWVDTYRMAIHTLLADPQIDGLILIGPTWMEYISPGISEIIVEASEDAKNKPVASWLYEGWLFDIDDVDIELKVRSKGKGAIFPSPERAARALGRLAEYAELSGKK